MSPPTGAGEEHGVGSRLNLFDLNLLRVLDVLLHEKSVTRAAEKLHVTQQAMSGSLKRLREHFGDELLVRVGLRLEPTPLGAALVVPVREAMLQIALAVEATPSFLPAESDRRFGIALSDYGVASFFPHMIARVMAQAPKLGFDIDDVTAATFAGLEAGDLHLSVQPNFLRLRGETAPNDLRWAPLYQDDFVCAIDPSIHDLDALTTELYLLLPHAHTRLPGLTRTAIDNAWDRNGVKPRVAVTTTSFTSSLLMIPGTPMIATVQRFLVRQVAKALPIRMVECPLPIDPLSFELYWHERNDADPGHRWVREQILATGSMMAAFTS